MCPGGPRALRRYGHSGGRACLTVAVRDAHRSAAEVYRLAWPRPRRAGRRYLGQRTTSTPRKSKSYRAGSSGRAGGWSERDRRLHSSCVCLSGWRADRLPAREVCRTSIAAPQCGQTKHGLPGTISASLSMPCEGATGTAWSSRSAAPAAIVVPRRPDTSGNAGCGTSCGRSRLAGSLRSAGHVHPAPRCGTARWPI